MSIRGKLIAFIIGTVALIQLAWGLSVVRSDAMLMEHEAARKSRAILHAIGAPIALHMATREFEAIDAVLEVYAKRSTGELAFRSIAVLDMNGVVVAHSDPREYGKKLDSEFVRAAMVSHRSLSIHEETQSGRILQVSMPVVSGLRWGTIVADTSLSGLDDRVVANQLKVLVSTFLIACSTAVLIWILLSRMVFLPLEAFARTSRSIGQGDFSARLDIPDTKDELALLGRTLNEMADRVEGHAARLEATVQARTRELEDANSSPPRSIVTSRMPWMSWLDSRVQTASPSSTTTVHSKSSPVRRFVAPSAATPPDALDDRRGPLQDLQRHSRTPRWGPRPQASGRHTQEEPPDDGHRPGTAARSLLSSWSIRRSRSRRRPPTRSEPPSARRPSRAQPSPSQTVESPSRSGWQAGRCTDGLHPT